MKRIVDTSAWIEVLAGTALGQELLADLPEDGDWVIPTIVQLELSKWLLREQTVEVHNQIVAFSMTKQIVPMDSQIALEAAVLSQKEKLATADAIILATARIHNADILTCDGHFESIPEAVYRPKMPV